MKQLTSLSVREGQTPLDVGQAHVIVLGLTGIEVR